MNTPTLIANSQICAPYSAIAANSSSRAGDWISLANYHHATIIATINDVTGDVTTFTLNQATSNAGGSSKTLGITEYWRKTHASDLTGTTTFTRVTQASAATFASVASSVNIIVVEIRPEELDVSGGFDFFSVDHAAGTTTGIIDVTIILSGPRHARELNVAATS